MEKEKESKPTSSMSNFGFRHNHVALEYMIERNKLFKTGVAALEFFVCYAIASNIPYEPESNKPWIGKPITDYQMAISTVTNRALWLPEIVGYYCGGNNINPKIDFLANAGLERFIGMVKSKFKGQINFEDLITHNTILEIMEETLKENPIEDISHQSV